jgi:hypothetical protein
LAPHGVWINALVQNPNDFAIFSRLADVAIFSEDAQDPKKERMLTRDNAEPAGEFRPRTEPANAKGPAKLMERLENVSRPQGVKSFVGTPADLAAETADLWNN